MRNMATFAEGEPSWVDLASPDIEGARRFYGRVFGWSSTVATEPEAGGYTMFHKDEQAVAAVGPLMGEGQPSVWTTYFNTSDVEAAGRRVGAAGGKVLMATMEVLRYGRMAIFLDPSGAPFAMWEPAAMTGAELTGAPGSMSWVELTTRDTEGSKAFYPAVLGWSTRDVPLDGATYTVWKIDRKSVGGMMPMEGELWPADLPPHWMVYFEVEDCDVAAGTAEKAGGTVSVPPTDTPAGRFAVLADPYGAFFSIIKSDPSYSV
jgi:predicted enzyme related to lactoylglutathione lyase